MSRSYKKHPICTDRTNGAKYWKRQANHRVRKYRYILQHKQYKKIYYSYDIHDWISRWSKAEALDKYYHQIWYDYRDKCWGRVWDNYENEKDFLNHYWAKYYKRK